jgi:hypothetical protein
LDAECGRSDSFHIESHAGLVETRTTAWADGSAVAAADRSAVDAVVVPTIRPQHLFAAAQLADGTDCVLLVLCSTSDQAERARAELSWMSRDRLFVFAVPPAYEHDLLCFRTAAHPELEIDRSSHADIARKRNLGLLFARLCGWRIVFFLDDDIRSLSGAGLAAAAGLTKDVHAVGFNISQYPDNSVVCHANRLAGGKQDVFPGGSALIIDFDRTDSFFPPIYNEDWLFLFDALRSRSVAVAGSVSQLEYEPFANPRRAAAEEFGDLIAEGLYRLIHQGSGVTDATRSYWRDALALRSMFIDDVAERLLGADGPTSAANCALMSLAAARKRLLAISPLACVSFVRAWRADLDAWRQGLRDNPILGAPADAAKFLGLASPDRCVTP